MLMRSYFSVFFFLIACNSSSEKTEPDAGTQPTKEEPAIEKQVENEVSEETKKEIGKIGKVKSGMSEEEVIEIMGEPTSVETLNAYEQTKAEDWFYGDNQKIRLIRGVVNRVSHNIEGENAIIKELIEAKQAGDAEKEKELLEKLANSDY